MTNYREVCGSVKPCWGTRVLTQIRRGRSLLSNSKIQSNGEKPTRFSLQEHVLVETCCYRLTLGVHLVDVYYNIDSHIVHEGLANVLFTSLTLVTRLLSLNHRANVDMLKLCHEEISVHIKGSVAKVVGKLL